MWKRRRKGCSAITNLQRSPLSFIFYEASPSSSKCSTGSFAQQTLSIFDVNVMRDWCGNTVRAFVSCKLVPQDRWTFPLRSQRGFDKLTRLPKPSTWIRHASAGSMLRNCRKHYIQIPCAKELRATRAGTESFASKCFQHGSPGLLDPKPTSLRPNSSHKLANRVASCPARGKSQARSLKCLRSLLSPDLCAPRKT